MIEDIKNIVFNRSKNHNSIQNALVNYFRSKHYRVIPEYSIAYRKLGRIERLQGNEDLSKGGKIDIYAQRNQERIAIEYDSGATIRWKSIEKLLQSEAHLCIAICYTAENYNSAFEKNLRRIRQVHKEIADFYEKTNNLKGIENLFSKEVWLGIATLKLFKSISFQAKNKM